MPARMLHLYLALVCASMYMAETWIKALNTQNNMSVNTQNNMNA